MRRTQSAAYRLFTVRADLHPMKPGVLSKQRRKQRRHAILLWRLWKKTRGKPEHLLTPGQRGLLSQNPPAKRPPKPYFDVPTTCSECLPPGLSRKKRVRHYRQQLRRRRKL